MRLRRAIAGRAGRRAFVVSLALLGTASFLFASLVRTLNLEQMTAHADRIFHGRCAQVRVAEDAALRQVVTYVTFVPQGSAKGTVRGRLTIKLLGNQSDSARPDQAIEGIPRFHVGEEVVLFLYPDSPAGLTSPVGFGQGKFTVARDKAGRPMAINAFGNARILDGISRPAQMKLGPKMEKYRRGGGIPPEALLDMARSLE